MKQKAEPNPLPILRQSYVGTETGGGNVRRGIVRREYVQVQCPTPGSPTANGFWLVRVQTRSSATAEKQRVSSPHGGGYRPSDPLYLRPLWLHLCIWSNPKPATNLRQASRLLSALGHSRSFKVILIGVGRDPERCVVVMCN